MKQVIRRGFQEIIVDEVPDPALAPHHVLVRPQYSLISAGTETASIHQEGVLREIAENRGHLRKIWEVAKLMGPVRTIGEARARLSEYGVLGYSGAGIVAARHETVRDIQVGDRVAYGGEGTGHGETVLVGRNLAAPVPDAVPFEHACFATLGSIAMNAARIAAVGLGDLVAVIGLGLVGQLVAQLVKLEGGVVAALDLKPERVDLARKLGADYGFAGGSPREQVGAVSNGRGADCVIVAAAAKSAAPARLALELCRERGRIVVVGAVELEFPWSEMYLKEIQLFMARAYGPGSYDPVYEQQGRDYPFAQVRWTENRNMAEFLRLVGAGRIQLQPLITHQFPLAEAACAYQTIMEPGSRSLAVLLRYPAADAAPDLAYVPRRKVEIAVPEAPGRHDLRAALAGAGNLAKWDHLPNLKKLDGVSLRAVQSSSGARGKSYALRFGARYCTSEYDELVRDPEIDFVVITSRNQYHAPQALAALRAGKHVFLEKPMALTQQECRELCAAEAEARRCLTVGFNRRFAPFYVEAKKQLARRAGPAVISCVVNSPGISGAHWMADAATGGAILGEACHFVDLMYWLLDSEPVSVAAWSLPLGRQEPIGENNLAASFRFADGSIGNLTYSTVGSRTSGGERVDIFAQGAGVTVENFKRLAIRGGMRHSRSTIWAGKGYAAQLADFVEAIRKGRPPAVTARDGARATIGCLAMLESARTQAPVTIALESALVLPQVA